MTTAKIETPYGKKTPELLCRAMDALSLQPELVETIENLLALFDASGNTRPYTWQERLLFILAARAQLAKVKGNL